MRMSVWFDDLPVLGKRSPTEGARKLREVDESDALDSPPEAVTCASFGVPEGERAGIAGYPIFIGLNVGSEGLAFKCFTVNVKNDDDEQFLAAMDSDVFKAGLKLITTVQPAIAPLSGMAVALTRSIAQRNRNVPVQDFYLGLDFTNIAGGARLAEGSYLTVQIPETLHSVWDWDDWVYHPTKGRVVNKADPTQLIPYNYIIFGVNRYTQ